MRTLPAHSSPNPARHRPRPHRLAIWLLGAAVLLFAADAAVSQEERPGVFGEVIDVRVVNVEVVVTGKDGLRIAGLGPEDFRLTVDGKPTEVRYFTEVVGGEAVAPPAGDAAAPSGVPALRPGEAVGTSYLVFIDEFFTLPPDRNRILDALAEDLPILGPEDRMAVVAYDGRGLEMLSSWSQSSRELERTLSRAQGRKALGLQRQAERRMFVSTRADARRFGSVSRLDRFSGSRLELDEQQYAETLAGQVEDAVSAAVATLRSFASPPGRKVMLLVSGGWPFNPAEYAVADSGRFLFDPTVDRGRELFAPLVDTANRLGYTLYPVDAPGLQGEVADASLAAPPDVRTGNLDPSFVREQEVHASLGFLARETGGQALLNARGLDALAEAYQDTRSYYWLGFSPDWSGDDESHEIRVEVLVPGAKVRSRAGFQDLSRRTEVSMMVESALLFGNSPSAKPLEVEIGEAKKAGRGKVEVPLTVMVPAGELTFLPQEGAYVGQAELRVAAVDEDGDRSEVPVVPLAFAAEEVPAADQLLGYTTGLLLRKGPHDLIVALYDPVGGTLLSTKKRVHF